MFYLLAHVVGLACFAAAVAMIYRTMPNTSIRPGLNNLGEERGPRGRSLRKK